MRRRLTWKAPRSPCAELPGRLLSSAAVSQAGTGVREDQFLPALDAALTGSFADLPEQIQEKLAATQDSWGIQSAPQIANFVYLFRSDGNNDKQVARDTVTGVGMLLLSAVYARFWPASYCDAPRAKGLVLTSNIFGSISSVSEAPLLVGNPWLWLELVIPVKITGYVVSDILGLTAYVLGLVD